MMNEEPDGIIIPHVSPFMSKVIILGAIMLLIGFVIYEAYIYGGAKVCTNMNGLLTNNMNCVIVEQQTIPMGVSDFNASKFI